MILAQRGTSEDTQGVRQSYSETAHPKSKSANVVKPKQPYYDDFFAPRRQNSPPNLRQTVSMRSSPTQRAVTRPIQPRSVPNLSPRGQRSSPTFRSPSPSAVVMPRQLPVTRSPLRRGDSRSNKTVVLTNVSPPMHLKSGVPARRAQRRPSRGPHIPLRVTSSYRGRPSQSSALRNMSTSRLRGRGRGGMVGRLQRNRSLGPGRRVQNGRPVGGQSNASISTQAIPQKHDSKSAVSMLNRLLRGVHFNSHNNLFYPGGLYDDKQESEQDLTPELRQELSEKFLSDILETTEQGAEAYAGNQSTPSKSTKVPSKHRKEHTRDSAVKSICRKLSKELLAAQVKSSKTKTKLSENEKFIRGQYQEFLERTLAQNPHPLQTKLASCKSLNKNNNNNDNIDNIDSNYSINSNCYSNSNRSKSNSNNSCDNNNTSNTVNDTENKNNNAGDSQDDESWDDVSVNDSDWCDVTDSEASDGEEAACLQSLTQGNIPHAIQRRSDSATTLLRSSMIGNANNNAVTANRNVSELICV